MAKIDLGKVAPDLSNNLTTESLGTALDAVQGKILKELIQTYNKNLSFEMVDSSINQNIEGFSCFRIINSTEMPTNGDFFVLQGKFTTIGIQIAICSSGTGVRGLWVRRCLSNVWDSEWAAYARN